ncbi:hypothetical protein [Streptococcus porci]|uniref:hypothetical protein n=1 Tax=Streptococcus porci TaxID=502567 RepID=UPI000418CA8F|nr:hypothetical protein [Streptococcus porci]
MEHNTELNYVVNSLFGIDKWHLRHFARNNPAKFEDLARYHLIKNHIEPTEEAIAYVRMKVCTKSNYSVRKRNDRNIL